MGGICGAYGERERGARVLGENQSERNHCGDTDADGRIILRWNFRNWVGVVGTGWSWLRIGKGGRHLGSKNSGNFLISCTTS